MYQFTWSNTILGGGSSDGGVGEKEKESAECSAALQSHLISVISSFTPSMSRSDSSRNSNQNLYVGQPYVEFKLNAKKS